MWQFRVVVACDCAERALRARNIRDEALWRALVTSRAVLRQEETRFAAWEASVQVSAHSRDASGAPGRAVFHASQAAALGPGNIAAAASDEALRWSQVAEKSATPDISYVQSVYWMKLRQCSPKQFARSVAYKGLP